MIFYKKLKKSQQIHINHHGQGSSDCITIFTTIRQYPKILDSYTSEAVAIAIDNLEKYYKHETTIEHKGVSVQVILVDSEEDE